MSKELEQAKISSHVTVEVARGLRLVNQVPSNQKLLRYVLDGYISAAPKVDGESNTDYLRSLVALDDKFRKGSQKGQSRRLKPRYFVKEVVRLLGVSDFTVTQHLQNIGMLWAKSQRAHSGKGVTERSPYVPRHITSRLRYYDRKAVIILAWDLMVSGFRQPQLATFLKRIAPEVDHEIKSFMSLPRVEEFARRHRVDESWLHKYLLKRYGNNWRIFFPKVVIHGASQATVPKFLHHELITAYAQYRISLKVNTKPVQTSEKKNVKTRQNLTIAQRQALIFQRHVRHVLGKNMFERLYGQDNGQTNQGSDELPDDLAEVLREVRRHDNDE